MDVPISSGEKEKSEQKILSLLDEYDILLMDNNGKTNISLENIQIPKVLIKKQGEKNNKDSIFNLVITLPINLIDFNQNIINLSQKHKFGKNSLIKTRIRATVHLV